MMLSRFAENAFWMGRYVERAENLARLLSVTETFAANLESEEAWTPILKVFADEQAFVQTGKALTPLNVAKFYLVDRANPNSVVTAIAMVKENARSLRHLISTECWRQISVFHDQAAALSKRRFARADLSEICEEIRISCFTHRGVIEATCYRDEVWRFNRLGAALDRADQMTRLLDMKYFEHSGHTGDDAGGAVGPPDVAWWNTLLRSASGYHAFQRRHSFNPEPADAAAFLLFDRQLPHSVRGAVQHAEYHLGKLEADFDARPGAAVKEAAAVLENRLDSPPDRLTGGPLHRYLDQIQLELNTLANALNERYFSP